MSHLEIVKQIRDEPHRLGWLLGYPLLSDIHSEWIKYLFDSGDTVLLQAHRNSYKTTCIVVGIIRELFLYPDKTILVVRKSHTDASKIVGEVQAHYERDELRGLYSVFGITDLKGGVWRDTGFSLSTKKSVTKEPNLESLGIDSSMTGAHYDRILLDDIVTMDDRISKSVRDKTKLRYSEIQNIPKKGGLISITGTPWHHDDAYVNMPVPKRYSIYDINPPILSEKEIDKIRKSVPASLFSANYELKHIADENKFFDNPKFGFPPEFDTVVAFLDPAYSGTHYTGLAVVGRYAGQLYATGLALRESVIDCSDKIVEFCRKHKTSKLYIETNADKGLSIKYFRDKFPGRCQYIEHRENNNKHQRILNYIKPVWDDLMFDPDCQSEWLNQILDYQERIEPDDAPDSLAGALSKLESGDAVYTLGNLG